jgi:hypothetical protein
MKYKLVKLSRLSGLKTSIYSIYIENEKKTLFDIFLNENKNLLLSELKSIISRLKTIGSDTGAREHYFKLNEGKPGDGVCALFDTPKKKLRLYCIRYGSLIVILGGGGPKGKNIRKLQDDKKLEEENYLLRKISQDIKQKMDYGEIEFTDDALDFIGNLEFDDDEI